MPELKFVAQFPVEDESLRLSEFRAEAQTQTMLMINQLGFTAAGPFWIEFLDLPLATYLQCTVDVQPLKFPGVK